MVEVKVLHMADMHLGWPFAALGRDGHRSRLRREELKEVFAGIINLAGREGVQVLLIAGDLFEHVHATRGLIKFIDDQFRRIPRTRVFISPGNHDPLLPDSYYRTWPWAENVHIFGPEGGRVDLPDLPVTVHGWGFDAWEVRACHLHRIRAEEPDRIHLAVIHGGDEVYHPFTPEELAATGCHYIALGHIHNERVVLQRSGRVIARYSGSPEALSFGEPGEHGVLLGTISRDRTAMQLVPTGRRRFITADVDVAGAVSPEDVAAAVRGAWPEAERLQHCFRVRLTGAVDPGLRMDLPVLEAGLQEAFYFLRLEDRTRPEYDLESLAAERTARGLFVQRLLAQERAAGDDEALRQRIRRALTLGLQALEGRGAR